MSLETIITELQSELARMSDVVAGFQSIIDSFTWTSYTPTLGAGGSMDYGSTTINVAKHLLFPGSKLGLIRFNFTGTTSGSAHTDLRMPLPSGWNWADTTSTQSLCTANDTAALDGKALPSSGVVVLRKLDDSNWGIGAGRGANGTIIVPLA